VAPCLILPLFLSFGLNAEYFMSGKCSEKTDVYAFGVFLLELVSGKSLFDLLEGTEAEDQGLYSWVSSQALEKVQQCILERLCCALDRVYCALKRVSCRVYCTHMWRCRVCSVLCHVPCSIVLPHRVALYCCSDLASCHCAIVPFFPPFPSLWRCAAGGRCPGHPLGAILPLLLLSRVALYYCILLYIIYYYILCGVVQLADVVQKQDIREVLDSEPGVIHRGRDGGRGRCSQVALLCIRSEPDGRPTMEQVGLCFVSLRQACVLGVPQARPVSRHCVACVSPRHFPAGGSWCKPFFFFFFPFFSALEQVANMLGSDRRGSRSSGPSGGREAARLTTDGSILRDILITPPPGRTSAPGLTWTLARCTGPGR